MVAAHAIYGAALGLLLRHRAPKRRKGQAPTPNALLQGHDGLAEAQVLRSEHDVLGGHRGFAIAAPGLRGSHAPLSWEETMRPTASLGDRHVFEIRIPEGEMTELKLVRGNDAGDSTRSGS
jgi:hypothetical protein